MTANGQPDNPRSSRYIIKDFVNGKLLYCVSPPNHPQDEFHVFSQSLVAPLPSHLDHLPDQAVRAIRGSRLVSEAKDFDREFVEKNTQGVHTRGKGSILISSGR